jgi:flagellar motor switch protein FliN/FliY
VTQSGAADPRGFTPHSAGAPPEGGVRADLLRAFAEGFFEGAGPALITVLNRAVTVRVLGVEPVRVSELAARTPFPWVLVTMPYGRGLSGTHALVFSMAGAVRLGRALVGEEDDGGGDFLPAHEEALRETVNQILLSAPATLAAVIPRSVTFGAASVLLVDGPSDIPADVVAGGERVWLIRAEVTGAPGFHTELAMTVSGDLARELAELAEANTPATPVAAGPEPSPSRLDMILDITLPVTVELGRTRMQIQDVLKLAPGSVIELEKSAGDPVELYINDRPIARGEVVVIDENFGVRLTSIVTPTERIRSLR